ncbi:MAG TPA: sigma-70 family RNA polymerase sigma factor [Phycisphaerales bacterium]|nr:sigma-70 family RNA polymerase sigma factor [Phycisphaerales bacterium]HMP36291.1 sigma-70 family RNA polymerase sigma factor [Phycisphaerales bacterium]
MSLGSEDVTSTRLLVALGDSSDAALHRSAWIEFDARYRPIIHALAMRSGLGADDAADLAQVVLGEFARDFRGGAYERDRGRLRTWLLAIARHRIIDAIRRRRRAPSLRGDSALAALSSKLAEDIPGPAEMESIWERERRMAILDRALATLRTATRTDERTLEVFELAALKGVPAEEVAAECGTTVAEVYRIKHRLTGRLRELVAKVSMAYDDDGSLPVAPTRGR